MKYDAIGLLHAAAMGLKRRDTGTAYAVAELANNLRLLMRGEATLDEFRACYTGQDGEALDLARLFPEPEKS
jgi:hypothetical protein